jgi:mitochondrial GTPase 1
VRRQKVRRLLPYAVNQLRTRRAGAPRMSYNILVVGMPNVGKSTIVNAIRNVALKRETSKKVAQTGPRPGVTRAISNALLVHKSDPRIYLVDTPGVFVPRVPNVETGLKLALISR